MVRLLVVDALNPNSCSYFPFLGVIERLYNHLVESTLLDYGIEWSPSRGRYVPSLEWRTRHFEPRSDDDDSYTELLHPSSSFRAIPAGRPLPYGVRFNVQQAHIHSKTSVKSGFELGALWPETEILPLGHRDLDIA
ncbi:hypothetical protein AVEN_220015-1 [Araneus ventricosus]|uniref:Uncharacterized protein n=1 Tax=Araneus ventricosus TaxID=182803 RepID=A0A4Y2CSB9_ARAVE|nr:hypothetical protein AVEN_220015-1 [Araneus ventricosus]